MHRIIYLLLATSLFWVKCAPTKTTSTTSERYEEDLSYLRKKEQVNFEKEDNLKSTADKLRYADLEPQNDLKSELDSVVRILNATRDEVEYLNGFTIQLYKGSSREVANEMKDKIYEYSDQYDPEVSYVQPNFRVKVGKFFDRLEANKVYVDLKKEFPSAIVIPERIYFD